MYSTFWSQIYQQVILVLKQLHLVKARMTEITNWGKQNTSSRRHSVSIKVKTFFLKGLL